MANGIEVKLTGELRRINPIQEFPNFKKRTFHIAKMTGEYEQVIEITLTGDKVAMIDTFKPGDTLSLSCNLEGKEWTKDGKTTVFNTLRCWRIELLGSVPPAKQLPKVEDITEPKDDLPF